MPQGGSALRAQFHAEEIRAFLRMAYMLEVIAPVLPTAGLEVARLAYEEAFRELLRRHDEAINLVARMFQCNRVGLTEYIENGVVRFSYIEQLEQRHLLTWERHRTRHTQELLRAIPHPLDEPGVPRDERTRQLITILPPSLTPYARIITGMKIQKQQEHAGTEQGLTRLGQVVHGTRQAASDTARAVGHVLSQIEPAAVGIAAGVGLGLAALGSLASAAMAVAVADPCLTIGEYCLHGWE